ncbi:hypothetical protein [Yinghuangia soli]|uniref:Uncharacterized protein n=1 Tax=Yinghuangia soli TaxID=2908204 RepID=A0AA41Q686_9ACTN|nr:hypothetical protein [Yinghuangia soli]MCF2531982.1 hypothetical protein [Yinghuangia soli]
MSGKNQVDGRSERDARPGKSLKPGKAKRDKRDKNAAGTSGGPDGRSAPRAAGSANGAYELTAEVLEVDDDGGMSLYEASLHGGWGDGAPVLAATDDRVHALLAATPYPGDHVLGALPPRFGVATVELVAINAALAGVEPQAFSYVLAAVEALLVPEWNAVGLTTTTSSVSPMLIVNGPARDDLRIDYRAGCLGGAAGRGSMTIGRAVALCLRNIGGQRAGETSRTVFGQPARFGLCFGEWEERSPWPSLAERRGFGAADEVVTVHGGKGVFPFADVNNDDPRDLAYAIARTVAFPLNNWFLELTGDSGQIVLLLNPMWARRLGEAFPEAADFQEYIHEHAWQPVDAFRPANAEILAAKGRVDDKGRVALAARPDQFVPVVCGGLGGLHGAALTTFVQSEMQSAMALR